MLLLVKLVREKISMAFRKETFFSFVCINVLHQVDKSLVLHACSEIGMNVNI